MNRIDVLETTKGVLLLPNIGMGTTQQVADLFKVQPRSLMELVKTHIEELKGDGIVTLSKSGLLEIIGQDDIDLKTERGKFHITFNNDETFTFSNSNNRLFPKRAILRVAMLLRDSEVAKEIRTHCAASLLERLFSPCPT